VVRDGEAGTEKTEEYIIDQNSDKKGTSDKCCQQHPKDLY